MAQFIDLTQRTPVSLLSLACHALKSIIVVWESCGDWIHLTSYSGANSPDCYEPILFFDADAETAHTLSSAGRCEGSQSICRGPCRKLFLHCELLLFAERNTRRRSWASLRALILCLHLMFRIDGLQWVVIIPVEYPGPGLPQLKTLR